MISPRAVLYLRLSAVTDDSTSIVRQERDLREHATRRGWKVVDVLIDNGVSGRKSRANAARAVDMLASDEADVLAVWKLDRFTRQGWDGLGALSRALSTREAAGRPALFVALHDGLASDQPAFRLIAGVLSEVARTEAENTSARVRSSIAHRRTVARKVAGGPWPFGYHSVPAPDGVGRVLEPEPDEAPIVREVANRLADGRESVLSIVRDLDARRVPTSRSAARLAKLKGEPWEGLDRGTWSSSGVRMVWTNIAQLGRQPHRGDVVRDENGLPLTMWEPNLDMATFRAVQARFQSHTSPARRTRAARLLSGLVYCAMCGNVMYVTSSGPRNPGYRCSTGSNHATPCRAPRVAAEPLEDYIVASFLAVAGDWPEMVERTIGGGSAVEEELAEVRRALEAATAALVEADADEAELLSRVRALKERRAALEALPPEVPSTVCEPTGRTIREAWLADERGAVRRSLLAGAIDHVEVSLATAPTRRATIEDRVVVRWKS